MSAMRDSRPIVDNPGDLQLSRSQRSTSERPASLVILRGNSASGKTTVARALRERLHQPVAWVEQDYLRRTVLMEPDEPATSTIHLVDTVARYAPEEGFFTVLEGILPSCHYTEVLSALLRDYCDTTHCFYFDIPLQETLLRHETRSLRDVIPSANLRSWYRQRDTIPNLSETIIGVASSAHETVELIVKRFQ